MIRQYQAADLDPVIAVWGRASRMAHRFLDESFLAHEREMIATVWLTQAETWVSFVPAQWRDSYHWLAMQWAGCSSIHRCTGKA